MSVPKYIHRIRIFYIAAISLTLLFGLFPALLNGLIDPFEMFGRNTLSKSEQNYVEKIHYPLWKFSHYDRKASTIILGDSRARSLRDKYWKELGTTDAYNFAYGGGTIPEIYDTFRAVKNDEHLKTIIVGVQLRSFDETFKKGLNRVPEATKTTDNYFSYLKNWFVAKTSWKLLKRRHRKTTSLVDGFLSAFVTAAAAANLGPPGTTDVETLLRREVCFGCDLPQGGGIYFPIISKGPNLGLGRGYGRWLENGYYANLNRILPKKFARQVKRNARSDWKGFRFSTRYLSMMKEIATWADAREDRMLIFFIPPTILEMQNTIAQYGLSQLDTELRRRLSKFATVIDFDFPNELTHNLANFSDAYHFNSTIARQIVGEILLVSGVNKKARSRILKRRSTLRCRENISKNNPATSTGFRPVSCRIWIRGEHG